MPADVGTTTTIAFGTTSFAAEVMSINGSDMTRPDINVSHMGTTGYQEYVPGKLLEGGTVEMEINFDPDEIPPIDQPSESITITFPLPLGQGTAAKVVFSGYINSWSYTDPLEEKMTAEVTIKIDGQTAPVWSVSTT